MTPLQYEALYHELRVILDDLKITTVNVRRYQNNDDKNKENLNAGNKAALVQKDLLVGRMISEANKMTANALAKSKGKPVKGDPLVSETDPLLDMAQQATAGELSHLTIPEIIRSWIGQMMDVHSGKGSPDEIQAALHFIAIYGLYDKTKFGNNSAAGVRDYCDERRHPPYGNPNTKQRSPATNVDTLRTEIQTQNKEAQRRTSLGFHVGQFPA